MCNPGRICAVSVPNPLLETVETGLFVADETKACLALTGVDGSDETAVRVHRTVEVQHASNRRERGSGLAKIENLRVVGSGDPWAPR